MALWAILRKRRGLSEASPPRGVELLLETLVLVLQSIAVALGLSPFVLHARHLLTQARDLILLALDQIVAFIAGRSRALVGHGRLMPYRRKRYKYNLLDLAPSCVRTR
jgi:hypothetical protein